MESANKKIQKEIKATNGIYTKKRYQAISVKLNEVARKLRDNINSQLATTDLINAELEFQRKQLFKADSGVDLVLPTAEQISTAVQFAPFCEGANYSQYLNNIYNGFYDVWDNELRAGYLTGIPTKKIIQNVMGTVAKNGEVAQIGLIEKIRQSIERNTRTYLQSMATETRNKVYEKNSKLFKGYKYLATLDRRTCLLCAKYDGKIFKTLEEAPKVPQHFSCRCLIIPLVNGLDDILSEDTRASENGQVDSKLTYEDWLKSQSDEVQRDVLGKTRYEIFKNDGKIGGFVNDGKIVSVEKLK